MKPTNTCPDCHGPLTVECEIMWEYWADSQIEPLQDTFIMPFAGLFSFEGDILPGAARDDAAVCAAILEMAKQFHVAWLKGEIEWSSESMPYCAICEKHWPVEHFAPPPPEPEEL